MKLLGISGTIIGEKTSIVVQKVLEGVKKHHPNVEIELLDLREYDVQFCDGRNPATYTGDTKKFLISFNLLIFILSEHQFFKAHYQDHLRIYLI